MNVSIFVGEVQKSSNFKGVSFYKERPMGGSLWTAQAFLDGKPIHLGYHGSELAAAKAYDNWAKDFANISLNFLEASSNESSSRFLSAEASATKICTATKSDSKKIEISAAAVEFAKISDSSQGTYFAILPISLCSQ